MSIEANMQGVIENRNSNFYSQFDVYAYTTATYNVDPTSEFYGLTALEILEEEELFGGVPKEVLEWANLQKLSQRFVSQGEPDFDFVPEYDLNGDETTQTAEDKEKEAIYNARIARFKGLKITIEANTNIYYTDDESSEFFGYTYDEILGMHANGVLIPDEVLAWATSMADVNNAETSEDTEAADAETLYNTLIKSPFMNIKTITKIFVKKCDDEVKDLEDILETLKPIEEEMATAAIDAQTKREDAVKNIKTFTEEWLELEAKINNGEQLDASEQERFEELQELFGKENELYQEGIDNTTKNYNKFSQILDLALIQSDVAMDFGNKTIEVAAELSDFERTYKTGGLFGGLYNMGIGGILSAWGLAGTKNFSVVAHTIGIGTTHFAQDVQTTIEEVNALMTQTAENARFDEDDPNHIVEPIIEDEGANETPSLDRRIGSKNKIETTTDETSTPTSDVDSTTGATETTVTGSEGDTEGESGEGTDGTTETSTEGGTSTTEGEDEEISDEDLQAKGENELEKANAKELSHPELKRLIKAEGEDSTKKGKEAVKLVEQLKAQSQKVDAKEQEVEDANTEVEENSAEAAESSDGGATTEATENVASAEATAEQTVGELENEAAEEELTVQALRDTYKSFKKTNKKYTKDVKYADKRMKEDIYTGGFTVAGGGYMTGIGVLNIATGESLLATSFICPGTLALAYYLIKMGTIEIALGEAMIAGGISLTVSAEDGLEINKIAKEKISISNKDIETATETLDEFEATQVEAAEGEVGTEKTEEGEENEETEEDEEDPYLSKDEKLLVSMQKGNEELPPMMSRANKEGKISEKIGKQNVADVTKLTREIPTLIETTIAFETQKQAKQAEEAAGDAEGAQDTAAQDPAKIYEGYRTDFNKDLKQNAEFKKDINTTKTEATENLNLAAIGTTAGTARTALGTSEIAIGTILAAQWWSPMKVMLGLALIKKGTEDLALGNAMIVTGLALTVNSTATLATSLISGEKINESTEKTNNALTRVDEIEAQINAAVQEQMASEGGQDLSGMSVVQLLTVIIANGIKSSTLGAENQEILEMVREQFPQIMESVSANSQKSGEDVAEDSAEATENAAENTSENAQGATAPEGAAQGTEGQEGGESNNGIFAPYINDYKTDLQTNTQYTNEVKQASQMKRSIKSGFFLGAPVEKANARIQQSTEQTTTALEEVQQMEKEYNKAVEEAKQAAKEAEEGNDEITTETQEGKTPAGKSKKSEGEEEITPEDAEKNSKDAEGDAKDEERKNIKREKKFKKQDKKVAKSNKKIKNKDKEIKTSQKNIETNTQEMTTNQDEGNALVESTSADDVQAKADSTEGEMGECDTLETEAYEIVNEVIELTEEVKSGNTEATAENQGIVSKMQAINAELQQDQGKMEQISQQIMTENKKVQKSSKKQPAETPAQQQPAPQPQPDQKPAPVKKAKKAKKVKPEVEDVKPENNSAQTAVQQPQTVITEQEKPEGADKTQYASDANKAPDFIGFVAQSDSLASGAVLAGKSKKTPVTNNKQSQGNNQQQNTNNQRVQAKRKAQTKAKKEEEKENKAANSQQPVIKPAQRTTQKPFDINSMNNQGNTQNGAGGTKITTLRQSAQQLQAEAFNKQAKLSAMAVRASNNVEERIRKEAEAQAEAARKQRQEQEKQQRIAKIKEKGMEIQNYGSIAIGVGVLTKLVGNAIKKPGEILIKEGENMIAGGTLKVSDGKMKVATGKLQQQTGQTQLTSGNTQVSTGQTNIATGNEQIQTGNTQIQTGTPMMSAVEPATVAAGTALVVSGTSLVSSGTLLVSTGTFEVSMGTLAIASGNQMIATGLSTMVAGQAQITAGATEIAAGNVSIAAGTPAVVTGGIVIGVGETLQTVGEYTVLAGTALSSYADVKNGNILGAITTIAGAVGTFVGGHLPVSDLAQTGIQLATSSVQYAGQINQMFQNQQQMSQNQQGNGQQKKQPDQKKMKKIQNNKKTNNIVNKSQKKQQTVGNRFNK